MARGVPPLLVNFRRSARVNSPIGSIRSIGVGAGDKVLGWDGDLGPKLDPTRGT